MTNLSTMEQNGNHTGAMAHRDDDDNFEILDPRSSTGVRAEKDKARVTCIATISAGYKKEDEDFPRRSKNGEIYIHGNAPGLEAELKKNDMKRLTVIFPSDSKKDFIQQRFTEYTKTALKTFGDQHSVTEILGTGNFKKVGEKKVEIMERRVHLRGTPEYVEAIGRCRVSCSVYFVLARWRDNGADIMFPDGVGLYRIRFTSLRSLEAFSFAADYTKKMTGGILTGIPFDLSLEDQESSDSDGFRRKIWVWQVRTKPQNEAVLDALTFRRLAIYGQSQVQMLQLQAPEPEGIETALAEADIADIAGDDAVEAEVVSSEAQPDPQPAKTAAPAPAPALCDARDYQKKYFAIAGRSKYSSEDDRATFIGEMTGGKITSLSTVLSTMTTAQADELMEELKLRVDREAKATPAPAAPPATTTTTTTAAAPDPLARHKRKIICQAKELFGDEHYKEKLAVELGQPQFTGLSADELNAVITRFQGMIDAKAAAQAPAATPQDAFDDADDANEEPLEAPNTPLSQALRAKREQAAQPAADDGENPFADDPFSVDENGEVIE